MSVKRFIGLPQVKAKFKPLRPKLPRKIDAPLKVAPRTEHYKVVGTAFDYLLRFEIQRRAPHARAETWVAESAPGCIWGPGYYLHLPSDSGPEGSGTHEQMEAAREMSGRMRAIVENAQAAVAAYIKSRSPTPPEQADLASHAIRLAKLDDVSRALRPDLTFENADPEDVQDLLGLLAIVPWGELVHDKVPLLNPTFGESSALVGGTDADLIAGDTLIDFKTTKAGEVTAESLDQLLAYLLLARNEQRSDPAFPEIRRLALYFCRHGHVWVQEESLWTSHPAFPELEQWFCDHAKDECTRNQAREPPAKPSGQPG
jgi:hypothetical protein